MKLSQSIPRISLILPLVAIVLSACKEIRPLVEGVEIPATLLYTPDDQISCAFSFLAYLDEEEGHEDWTTHDVEVAILDSITKHIPDVSVLQNSSGGADWQIVWGPAVEFSDVDYQENMMFVVQQISKPKNFKVVIRGTNSASVADWWNNDLKVGNKVPWLKSYKSEGPYGMISEGTSTDFHVLMELKPAKPFMPWHHRHLPGEDMSITQFLTNIAKPGVTIGFTGHSKGAAVAPTMALDFAQAQGRSGSWDPSKNVAVSVTSFAGPTPGDGDFATYFETVIPKANFRRFVNINDMVPRGWNLITVTSIPTMYPDSVDKMTKVDELGYDYLYEQIKDDNYQQMGTRLPGIFPISIQKGGKSFFDQVDYQHMFSYPEQLGIPEVTRIRVANNGGRGG